MFSVNTVLNAAPGLVLVVDDEAGLRHMLEFGLTKRGYQVFAAADGDQALALAAQHPFDLAVCDIMMPGKDGMEVLAQLKNLSPGTEVIMATGYATLETAIEAMKRGAFDYITKPFTLSHLCLIFEKALERRRLKARVSHLEEVVRLKNEFVAHMSHELRTPLASTMGFVSLLLHGVYGALNEAQKTALLRAGANSQSLLNLINSILDFSKLSANKMTVTLETFPLSEVITDAVQTMEPLAKSRSLEIRVEGQRGLTVQADKVKLKQVLINLIGNGIKFTKTGTVSLSVQEGEGPKAVRIRVQDTGIGIAEKDLPLLFQEFQQIDMSASREYTGTGLGLVISKKFVELMGGTITVTSHPGAGTTFTLELPIRTEANAPGVPLEVVPTMQEAGVKTVVAIDDDPDALKLLADSLGGTPFRLAGARSGKEGLELIRKLQPYCVLLDICMPDMDGWAVLQELKNDSSLRTIPVCLVTMIDQEAHALSLGVDGYIQKPFKREQLLKQLSYIPKKMKQILVVDDDPDIRRVFTDALASDGYEVASVGTGEEAMTRMSQLCPDVLFLDLMLPGISGFEVLQTLGEKLVREEVSVFVMTAKDLTEEEEDYLRHRVQSVLRKGTMPLTQIIERFRTHLARLPKVA
jgi:CheY-like chemotaxis protein